MKMFRILYEYPNGTRRLMIVQSTAEPMMNGIWLELGYGRVMVFKTVSIEMVTDYEDMINSKLAL